MQSESESRVSAANMAGRLRRMIKRNKSIIHSDGAISTKRGITIATKTHSPSIGVGVDALSISSSTRTTLTCATSCTPRLNKNSKKIRKERLTWNRACR